MALYEVHRTAYGGQVETVVAGITIPNNRKTQIELNPDQVKALEEAGDKNLTISPVFATTKKGGDV